MGDVIVAGIVAFAILGFWVYLSWCTDCNPKDGFDP